MIRSSLFIFIFVCFGFTRCDLEGKLNRESAINNTRAILAAENQYRQLMGRYGSMNELVDKGFLERKFEDSKDSGYLFNLVAEGEHFKLIAIDEKPQALADQQQLSLYVDESGVIRVSFTPGIHADSQSSPL